MLNTCHRVCLASKYYVKWSIVVYGLLTQTFGKERHELTYNQLRSLSLPSSLYSLLVVPLITHSFPFYSLSYLDRLLTLLYVRDVCVSVREEVNFFWLTIALASSVVVEVIARRENLTRRSSRATIESETLFLLRSPATHWLAHVFRCSRWDLVSRQSFVSTPTERQQLFFRSVR